MINAAFGKEIAQGHFHEHHRLLTFHLRFLEELLLRPSEQIDGIVELAYAKIGLLRDDPATWPARMQLDGLSYESLDQPLTARQRLDWLHRDTDGYQPQLTPRNLDGILAKGHSSTDLILTEALETSRISVNLHPVKRSSVKPLPRLESSDDRSTIGK